MNQVQFYVRCPRSLSNSIIEIEQSIKNIQKGTEPFSSYFATLEELHSYFIELSAVCSIRLSKFSLTFSPLQKKIQNSSANLQQISSNILHSCLTNLTTLSRYLTNLTIIKASLNDQSLIMIVKAKWKFINNLTLSHNLLTEKGMKILAEEEFTFLNHFSIAYNKIGNKGLKHFSKTKWNKLQEVNLSGIDSTNDSIHYLFKRSYNLKRLYFRENIVRLDCLLKLLQVQSQEIIIGTALIDVNNSVKCLCCLSCLIFKNNLAKQRQIQKQFIEESIQQQTFEDIFQKKILF